MESLLLEAAGADGEAEVRDWLADDETAATRRAERREASLAVASRWGEVG